MKEEESSVIGKRKVIGIRQGRPDEIQDLAEGGILKCKPSDNLCCWG
jgi:hypothetical protein